MIDLEKMVAEFEARGGKVEKIAEGERAIESDRKIYKAIRDGKRAAGDAVEIQRLSERRWEAQQEAYRAAKYDGWTDQDALDYANEAKP
jgi:hypothetical protein